jgi:predicted dehydrogenase
MMEHGKHVICEKPVASNITEATRMFEIAEKNGVVLFEAYKSQFLPNFKQVQLGLEKIGKVHKAHINYCQYSSRYQKYLNGENPNTFNPAFSNGSLVDIGFYCVAATVALFGEPENAQASAKLLESGVDAHGCAIFQYPEFDVTLAHSKVSDSYAPSEIQGEQGAIIIDHIAECTDVKIRYRDGSIENLTQVQSENSMSYEAQAFADCIGGDHTTQTDAKQRALTVAKLITKMRQQVGVVYPADK